MLELIDGTRDVQRDHRRVGPRSSSRSARRCYGLLNAGFIHRIGKTAAPAAAAASEGRVDEHRNLGIAFYKTAMFDEAMREFRRVLELRERRYRRRASTSGSCSRGSGSGRTRSPRSRRPRRSRARTPPVFHNLAYVLEQLDRYDEARVALDEAVRRGGAKDPRVQTSLGVVSLLAGDLAARRRGAHRGAAAVRQASADAGLVSLRGARRRAARRRGARRRAILNEGVAAHPHAAVLLNNLAAVLERDAATTTARARWPSAACTRTPASRSCTRISATCTIARRATTRRSRRTCARRRSIPSSGGDMYLKLGNIRLRRQERDEAVRCWERALELDPDNAIVRTNLESVRQVF